MKPVKHLILAATIVGVPGIVLGAATAAGSLNFWFNRPPAGIATAHAIREAAINDAHSAFWIAAANCFNDSSAQLPACYQEAVSERNEALDEAEDTFDARMDLLAILGDGAYDPAINPLDFSSNVSNSFHPLVPGRTLVYEKMTAAGLEHLEVSTLAQTIQIAGVDCRIVRDVESLNGIVKEDTQDWFAQHVSGDVWYFGEIVLNYENGFLEDLGGSWRTGKDGAKAGVIMLAAPAVGAAYRQEFLPNVAEDVAVVIATGVTISVAYGTFTNCVKTREGSPLEPGNFEFKYYAPGVGLVAEEDPVSGELLELIQIL
jgi:hypothetical protein